MPDNIFKGSYEGASSTGSGQQIHKKAVFFDADGTICDIEKGTPASAVEAITKLVKNGHQAWLCTGRSRAFVPDYLEQIPFTGMISACGCTIEKDGKRLFNKEMTTEEAWHSVEVLRKYGMIPVMEGADWMYYDKDEYNTDINWYADLITKALGGKWRPVKGYEHDLHINKISSKIVPGSDPEKACAELEDYYEFIGHVGEGLAGDTIEMIPKGFSKAVGIAAPEIHEEEEEEPVEIKKLAIPRYSPAQLAAKAKKEGDAPDIVKDEITKVTLFDYSDIFADEEEDEDEYYDDED